ncbi:phosphopantetheine-binding protein [Pontibacter pamirensis]|uniref:phosphopantetheine-binding protein n=1 Tax=Pontibacter pamirensis TaxID=2562824 RepID=UPI001389ECCD|nr:phosphopantetheine-binding protein [Pontibacter pamirensis]
MISVSSNSITRDTILKAVSNIVGRLKHIDSSVLSPDKGLWEYGIDIVDVVDIILAVEKKYSIVIPDEVPVYTIDDFVNYVALSFSK